MTILLMIWHIDCTKTKVQTGKRYIDKVVTIEQWVFYWCFGTYIHHWPYWLYEDKSSNGKRYIDKVVPVEQWVFLCPTLLVFEAGQLPDWMSTTHPFWCQMHTSLGTLAVHKPKFKSVSDTRVGPKHSTTEQAVLSSILLIFHNWQMLEAVFLYCFPQGPSCLANLNSTGWATWAVSTVIRTHSLIVDNKYAMFMRVSHQIRHSLRTLIIQKSKFKLVSDMWLNWMDESLESKLTKYLTHSLHPGRY